MKIVKIDKSEYLRFKEIRLRSLTQNPESFGTTLEIALSWPMENWIAQVDNIPTFIASIEGQDVGVVRVAKDPNNLQVCWIISMWVDSSFRGQRIGEKLMNFAIEHAKQNRYMKIKLDVCDSNTSAIRLYDKIGFRNNGITCSFPEPRSHIKEHQRELDLSQFYL